VKKIILLIAVLGVIAAGWFLYFNDKGTNTKVNVCKAKLMDMSDTLEFSGKTAPKTAYGVMSETGGTVESIYVSEGSAVKKGDALFDLDASEVRNLLQQAQINCEMLENSQSQAAFASGAAAEKAKLALALSQTTGYDYESFNSAFSGQLADNAASMASSLNALNLSGAEGTDAYGSVRLAELRVESLRRKLDAMCFTSLIKGTVLNVSIHKGEVLAPGTPAMVVADTDDLLIDAYVYERDLNKLSEGMSVKISTEEGVYDGKITEISKSAADTAGQSNYGAMTKIVITPEKRFKKVLGAEVDVEVVFDSKEDILALPVDCLTDDGCVFVVGRDGVLEKRAVTTGFKNSLYAEILSGVVEGETAVLSPQNLKEGQKVVYD